MNSSVGNCSGLHYVYHYMCGRWGRALDESSSADRFCLLLILCLFNIKLKEGKIIFFEI